MFSKLGCKKMYCCMFIVNPTRKQTHFIHQQQGVQILEPQLCKDTDCKEHEDAVNEEAMKNMFHHCFLLPCLHVTTHEHKKNTVLLKNKIDLPVPVKIKRSPKILAKRAN